MKIGLLGMALLTVSTSMGEMTAREIIQQQTENHQVKNETTSMTLTLIDRKGFKEVRSLHRLDKDMGNNLMSSLTVFDAPADIRNTALLTRENENKPNDQWLYFPSQRRLLRIAQARRNAYFMGTDFTYEDMDPEKTDEFTYRLLEPGSIDGSPCYVIEATPANKEKQRASGYGHRTLWIRKDIFYTVKIDFFDRDGILIKTQTNSALEHVKGTVWRAKHSLMDNLDNHHKTEVLVTSSDTETELSPGTFTDRYIRTGRYMK